MVFDFGVGRGNFCLTCGAILHLTTSSLRSILRPRCSDNKEGKQVCKIKYQNTALQSQINKSNDNKPTNNLPSNTTDTWCLADVWEIFYSNSIQTELSYISTGDRSCFTFNNINDTRWWIHREATWSDNAILEA